MLYNFNVFLLDKSDDSYIEDFITWSNDNGFLDYDLRSNKYYYTGSYNTMNKEDYEL